MFQRYSNSTFSNMSTFVKFCFLLFKLKALKFFFKTTVIHLFEIAQYLLNSVNSVFT